MQMYVPYVVDHIVTGFGEPHRIRQIVVEAAGKILASLLTNQIFTKIPVSIDIAEEEVADGNRLEVHTRRAVVGSHHSLVEEACV